MKSKFFALFTLITLAFCAQSCSDDCDHLVLNGYDADIIEWTMQGNDICFKGLIQGDDVTVIIPQSYEGSLTPVYTLSEGSTIFPEPASVADWSAQQQFTVVSADGQHNRNYTVSVVDAEDGKLNTPVVITSQKALEEFAALGYTSLDALTIYGKADSPITDLSPLNNITEVSTLLYIKNVDIENLELKSLELVGDLSINSPESLESISFPELRRALGDIKIGDIDTTSDWPAIHDWLNSILFPKLEYVAGSFTVYWCEYVTQIDTKALSYVGGDYVLDCVLVPDMSMISGLTKINGNLDIFSGGLKSLDGFNVTSVAGEFYFGIFDVPSLEKLRCLKSVKSLVLTGASNLTSLAGIEHLRPESITLMNCPTITSTEGLPIGSFTKSLSLARMESLNALDGLERLTDLNDIYIGDCPQLADFEPIAEISAKLVTFKNTGVRTFPSFYSLNDTDEVVIAYNSHLENLECFEELYAVDNLSIEGNDKLTSLNGLERLRSCDAIYIYDNPELSDYTAVRNLLILNWDFVGIDGNKYNPTLEQLENGETSL